MLIVTDNKLLKKERCTSDKKLKRRTNIIIILILLDVFFSRDIIIIMHVAMRALRVIWIAYQPLFAARNREYTPSRFSIRSLPECNYAAFCRTLRDMFAFTRFVVEFYMEIHDRLRDGIAAGY